MSSSIFSKDAQLRETVLPHTLFTVDVSQVLGKEYVPVVNDLVRFLLIQIGIQFMLFISDPQNIPFFSPEFIVLIVFLTVSVLFYWLIFCKIVSFT